MEQIQKAMALLLTLAVILTASACNSDIEEDDPPDYHYALTSLSAESAIIGVLDTAMTNEAVYLLAYDDTYQTGLYVLEQGEKNLVKRLEAGSAVAIAPDRNGGLWLLESVYDESAETTTPVLKQLDESGTVTKTMEIEADCQYVTALATDGNGNLYINDSGKILLLDAEGTYRRTVSSTGIAIELITVSGGGVAAYDTEEQALCLIDWDSGTYGTAYQLETSFSGLMDAVGGCEFYYYNDDGVYGYSAEDISAHEILLWLDCGVSGVSRCMAIDEETFLILESGLYLLEKTQGQALSDKTTLTLATLGLDQIVELAIVQFNRTNSLYQVEIVDYSQYNTAEDQSAGLTKLHTELISGAVPDLIDLSALPVTQYASKGLLADLGALMEADESFSRESYVSNILDALEIGGTLYSVVPAYQVSTVAGRTSLVGAQMGWTYSDFQAMLEETGAEAFANLTRLEVLKLLFEANQDSYIDWESGVSDFSSGDFARLLEMAKGYPSEIDPTGPDYTSEVIQLQNGSALLSAMTLRNNTNYMLYESILGDDLTFIGYPTPEGTAGSSVIPIGEIGIISSSENIEGAWAFLSYLLSNEVQKDIQRSAFPVQESALETLLAGYLDLGNVAGTMALTIDGEDVEVEITPLSEETVSKYRLLIGSLDTVQRDESDITDIILEEAEAYYTGENTLDETVRLIQNRVQLYMSERS